MSIWPWAPGCGIDLWAGEIVLSLAADMPLRLIAALPYRDIGSSFKGADKWAFGRIISAASETVVISEEYTRACMQQRNRFMVDNSSRLIAVIANEKSGTPGRASSKRSVLAR